MRTGVTAILPSGRRGLRPVFAGFSTLNGYGEISGTSWLKESGVLEGPVLLTNTYSVGIVRDAAVEWCLDHGGSPSFGDLPVVAETYDGRLNDIQGHHVTRTDTFRALDGARSGPVAEGNVGGGTGDICFGFKGGIGTSSRQVRIREEFTVGVLVQANHGRRYQLVLSGVPVGRELIPDRAATAESGSIVVVVATDAPLLPHQLDRLARRCGLGLARSGSVSGDGSGDFFLAFSTANTPPVQGEATKAVAMLANKALDPLFEAVIEATDEAIGNALAAARSIVGFGGFRAEALPWPKVMEILARFGRGR